MRYLTKESYMKNVKEQLKKLLKNKSLNMRQIQRITGLNEQQLKEAIEDLKAS